jgi:ribonucleoside-diphosphate reductase
LKVQKRDGRLEELNIENIRKQTIPACEGLAGTSYEDLELSAKIMFTDGIKTSDIQESLIRAAQNKIDMDAPNWTYVAARLRLYDLYHRIKRIYGKEQSGDVYSIVTLSDYINKNKELFSDWYTKYTNEEIEELNNYIVSGRDKLFTLPAILTVENRYLLVDTDEVVELPQHMFMTIAMFVAQHETNKLTWVKRFYDQTSTLHFIAATPINANGRKKDSATASCLVHSMADTLDSIMETLNDLAQGSKLGAGHGVDTSRLRATGSILRGIKNRGTGIVPIMKLHNDIALAVNQLGVRQGAITDTLEVWHIDTYDFIDLRKRSGEERRRAQDLFLCVSIPSLFIKRIKENGVWTFFDPYDAPNLTETYGEEFEALYTKYEKEFLNKERYFNPYTKQVPVQEVINKLIYSWTTEGLPFWFFKDNVNKTHKYHKELGIIRSSNLCVTAETRLLTQEYGNTPIGELVNKGITKVHCWNGDEWSLTTIGKTADSAKVLTVEFSNGETIRATEMHKWYVDMDGSMVELRTAGLKPGMLIYKYELPDGTLVDNVRIESVTDKGEYEPTYCGTEPKRHKLMFNGVLTGNCQELLQPVNENETVVCNLGSVNVARYTTDENLDNTLEVAVRFLDNVIDVSGYSTEKARRTQLARRSIGIGFLGEAEYLAVNHIHYGSKEHEEWIHKFYKYSTEKIDQYSIELAKEKGGCEVDPSIRNAYRVCIAPNTASGLLAGTTPSHEPLYARVYTENSKIGSYKVTAPNISLDNISYYKNAFEIPHMDQIRMLAARQKYIDMSISNSLYEEDVSKISSIDIIKVIVKAHDLGVKTLYYFRTKAKKTGEIEEVIEGKKITCEGCEN